MIQFELIFQMGGVLTKTTKLVLQSLEAKGGVLAVYMKDDTVRVCRYVINWGMFHEIASRCKCGWQWTSPD